MPPFLVLASVFFLLVKYATCENVAAYYILMFCCGFCMGGPFNIISSAIAADLVSINFISEVSNSLKGKNPDIKGDKRALATVAGIIEGTGSLGAALIQKFIPYIQDNMFIMLGCLCFMGGMIMLPTACQEYYRKQEKERKQSLLPKEEEEQIKSRKASAKITEITILEKH